MTGTEIYKRTETYEREAPNIRLHAPQWKLLLAFDGNRSLAEVALSVDVPFAEAMPLTERFLTSDWIAEQPITLDQYLKRTGASSTSAIGSAVPPVVVLHQPKASTQTTEEANDAAVASSITPPEPKPGVKKMLLSSVVDFILSVGGRNSIGHLLVYRVFLRVPPELLQREQIASIQLVDDNSVIEDSALQQAIAAAVNLIVKRPLPDSVFAAA